MASFTKSRRRNVIPATALAAASVTTAAVQQDVHSAGVRLYVTVSAVTAGGGTDIVSLCAYPPNGGAAIPIVGFSGVNMLSVAGTYVADFYPGAWLPGTVAAGGKLLGVAGISVPMQWAPQITMGAGNAATIAVDAEMLH